MNEPTMITDFIPKDRWEHCTLGEHDGRPSATVLCRCGDAKLILGVHEIDAAGVVTPSLGHLKEDDGCGYHEWVQLLDWQAHPNPIVQRGRNDAQQDRCENCHYASVGGEEMQEPAEWKAPTYIKPRQANAYLLGYREIAETW